MTEKRRLSTVTYVRLAIIAAGVILAAIIILQNTQRTETKLLFITVEMPRAVLLLVTLAVGFVLGLMTTGWIAARRKSDS